MTGEVAERLPEVLPTDEVTVEREQHRYLTYEGDNDTVLEEREYTLEKAPIKKIKKVQGVHDGESITFTRGEDYELSNDKERIVWLDDPADRPDPGSFFYVTYLAESIISRFIESNESELDSVENQLSEVINSKFVDKAKGEELDQIGELFGVLGKRRGRTDEQYRIYLKSIVQSFVSRGTISGIKTAISAATDVPIEDIVINEDFEENAYSVSVKATTPITGSLLEQVAQIADPSGVEQEKTRFRIPADGAGIDEIIDISSGTNVGPDETGIGDEAAWSRAGTIDEMGSNDGYAIDPNKHLVGPDEMGSNDGYAIDPNKHLVGPDEMGSNDSYTISSTTVSWDDGNWNSMDWAREHN